MKYLNAKKLHNGDEIISKKTGVSLYVINIEIDEERKNVFICCDDGNIYHHIEQTELPIGRQMGMLRYIRRKISL